LIHGIASPFDFRKKFLSTLHLASSLKGGTKALAYGAIKGQQITQAKELSKAYRSGGSFLPLREKERMRVGIPADKMFSKYFNIYSRYR
jgi:hypothetical protein